jgi:hypothetical protein
MAQGARQNTGQEAIVNLSKKLDEMLTVVADQYELQTQYLSSIDSINRESVSVELKAQTQILASIEAKLAAASSGSKGPAVDESGMKEYAKAFGSMSWAILDLIEKADEKAADKLSNFFTKLAASINDLIKNVDEKKATALGVVIETVAKSVISFGFWLTLATPLLATSLVGSLLLGVNIKLILGIIGAVDENAIAALAVVLDLGIGVLTFGFVMSLYTIFAIPALIGAVAFGLTVRLMLKAVGKPTDLESSVEAMYAVSGLGWGVLAFGLIMSFYLILAPTAFVGAMLFGLTVRLLLKVTNIDSEASIAAMNAVMGLGWGVLAFGLIMSIYIILAPTAFIGAMLFGLTVRLLMKVTNVDNEKSIAAIDAITGLGWGVLRFGLIMSLYIILAIPAFIGAMLFGLTVRLLLMISNVDDKKSIKGIEGINKLGLGVILFGIAMTLYLVLGIPAFLGAMLFGITIYLLMIVMKELGGRKVKKGIKGLMMLVLGIALFGLAVVLYNKFVKFEDTLNVVLQVALVSLTFILIGNFASKIKKGGKALIYAAAAVAALGAAMWLWSKAKVTLKDAGVLAATIIGLGVIATVAGVFASDIKKGSLALTVAALPVAALSAAMMIWMAAGVKLADVGVLGATIAGLAVAMGLIGAYEAGLFTGVPLTITMGSLAMTVAALPIAALSAAMMVWMAAGVKLKDVGTLGATIAIIGVEMALLGFASPLIILGAAAMTIAAIPVLALSGVMALWSAAGVEDKEVSSLGHAIYTVGETMAGAGLMSPLIILGAAAMTIASIPILALTGSLAVFKAAGIDTETGDNLSYALTSVVDGFLGGKMPGGILAGIKFAAGAAARAALLAVSSIGFLAAGVALIPITASMVIFKKADFSTTDSDNLEYMLSSVVRAFGIVTDYKRQKELGFYVNPIDLMLGIMSLSGAGRVLAGLAEGVQAWANLEVNEWEVVNGGTKDAKLVIKGRRKLNQSDFLDAAVGMSMVISAISKPFAEAGRLEKGQSSGNPILDAVFGGGFVSAGINSLKRSGDTLVSLAQGVQAFANLEITEYEVVAAGTKDAKLVPKSKRKLSPVEIAMAGINMSIILSLVAGAFADIGKQEKESSGVFSGGFVSKGVQALSGVGDILKSVTEGVISMAHNEIPQFDLIGKGTKDAKLVPGTPLVLTSTDLTDAAYNIGTILGVVADAVADIGRQEAESKGWFSDGYVGKGVAALGNIGDVVAKISEAVISFATGSVPTFELIGGGTKDAKLVPGPTIRLSGADLVAAGRTIGSILNVIGESVSKFGRYAEKHQGTIDAGVDASAKITKVVSEAATSMTEWAKVQKAEETSKNIGLYFDTVQSIFDPAKNKSISQSSWYFTKFAENMKSVSEAEDPLRKTANSMDSIQKSMKLMKDSINGMDLKKLTLTDSMMKSIAALSKNPEAMAKVIAASINKSYEELIKALKELSGSSGGGGDAKPAAAGSTDKPSVMKDAKPGAKTETKAKGGGDDGVKSDDAAAKKAGAQKVYIVNAPANWK